MTRHNPSHMRKSLIGRDLSTRLRNCLINMAAYVGGPAKWEDLVARYKHDPEQLHIQFLRTPGAGRQTWNELKEALKPELHGLDYTGRVVWLRPEEVVEMKTALERTLYVNGQDHRTLTKLYAMLAADTIHLGPG